MTGLLAYLRGLNLEKHLLQRSLAMRARACSDGKNATLAFTLDHKKKATNRVVGEGLAQSNKGKAPIMPKTRSGKKSVQNDEQVDAPDETVARLKTVHENDDDDDDDATTTPPHSPPLATQPAVEETAVDEEDEDDEEDHDADAEEEDANKKPAAIAEDNSPVAAVLKKEVPSKKDVHREADKHIFDIMDYQQEVIFVDRESRAKHFLVHQVRRTQKEAASLRIDYLPVQLALALLTTCIVFLFAVFLGGALRLRLQTLWSSVHALSDDSYFD